MLEIPSWEWPPEAGPMLLWFLRADSADREERLLAAQLAGDVVVLDDELAGSLLELAANDTEHVDLRRAAAIALGPGLEEADWAGVAEAEMDADASSEYEDDEPPLDIDEDTDEEDDSDYDEDDDDDDDGFESFDEAELVEASLSEPAVHEIQKTLRRLVADDGCPVEVRRAALEASVRAPQDWHIEAIREALMSGEPEWRITAIFCMGYVDEFDEHILEALSSTDRRVEFEAVRAAGTRGLMEAWPRVAELVIDKEAGRDLRLAAIEAAPNIYPEEAMLLLDELSTELADSEDEEFRTTLEEARETCAELEEMENALDDEETY